jgi:hypothetical protein
VLAIVSVCRAGEPTANDQDNVILGKILQGRKANGGFIVVAPTTYMGPHKVTNPSGLKERVNAIIKLEGYDAGPLVDKLLEKNSTRSRLSLESHPERGYLVDYDGQFRRYFKENGGGWSAWHRDHSEAHGYARVSLPVYDEKAGIVLVYIDIQSDRLAGAGHLVVYRYENGNLKELGRVLRRVS